VLPFGVINDDDDDDDKLSGIGRSQDHRCRLLATDEIGTQSSAGQIRWRQTAQAFVHGRW